MGWYPIAIWETFFSMFAAILLAFRREMETTAAAPACGEKKRLIEAYAVSISDYNRATHALQMRFGKVSRQEYKTLRDIADKAREISELTRGALDQHSTEHGC
jgi:hypothetical protein